jgi:hypothetical protein
MPTNKEIAGWLREAAGYVGNAGLILVALEVRDRATLVEQMRCETCRRWHPSKRWKNCEDRECLYGKNGVQYSAPDFYCCDWEEKHSTSDA